MCVKYYRTHEMYVNLELESLSMAIIQSGRDKKIALINVYVCVGIKPIVQCYIRLNNVRKKTE